MEELQHKIKVFAYVRKSTEQDQFGNSNKQPNSIAYQRRVVKEIADRNNIQIVKTFEDNESGYKAYVRDGFNKLCAELDDQGVGGEIKGIVCTEHNRLARNFGDGGRILWYLQNGEIEVIYTHDKVFTNSSSDQMMLAINFAMAKHSSDETSYRMKETWKQKALGGTPPNQRIPGYKYIGMKGKKIWVIDPIAGPLIKKVFEAYATGDYTISELVDFTTSIGLANKVNHGKPYSENTVREWLTKKEYIGIFEFEGKRIKGKYRPLMSEDLFYRVQEVLILRSHKRGKTKNMYAYSPKLIKCALCGEYMTGDIQKGNIYYKCTHRGEPCKSNIHIRLPHLKEGLVDKTAKKRLGEIEISEEKWEELSKLIKANYQYELGQYEQNIRQMRTKIGYEEEYKKDYTKSLSKLRSQEILTEEEKQELEGYQSLISDCNHATEVYNKAIDKAQEVISQIPLELEDFLESLKTATERFTSGTPINRRAIVETLCANMTWDGKNVSWEWKNRYKNLVEEKTSTNMLPE